MASGTGPTQMAVSSPWNWCTKASAGSTVPDRHGSAANRNGLGFSDHAVEHLNSERSLAVLTRPVAGVELGTDQALVSIHCRFRVIALPLSGRALPTNAAPFGHELDVMIARGLLIRISCAQHGVGPGWDEMDHLGRRPGLPGNGGLADGVTVVGTVRGDACRRARWNTSRSVSANSIASSEGLAIPPALLP